MEKNFAANFVDEFFAEPTYTFGGLPISKPKNASSSSGSLKSTNNKTTVTMNMQKKKDLLITKEKEDGAKKVADQGIKRNETERSSNISADAAWKEIQKACNSLPQLRGVDQRAEEFISKFRQDMKLEREKSLVEFQEMLARGV